jgi:hypothetical protein
MTSHLADAALRTAIARRNPTGTVVVHSDRGGQFRSHRYQRTLRAHGMTGSMGRVSSAGDNACDGVVLRTATEQRPQPAEQTWTICVARGTPRRDHHLDRADLPPPSTAARPRQAHPGRVRSRHRLQPSHPSSMTRTTAVNRSLGRPTCRHEARTRRGQDQGLPSSRLRSYRGKKPSRLSAKTWPGGLRTFRGNRTDLPPHTRRSKPTAPPSSPPMALYSSTVLSSRGA